MENMLSIVHAVTNKKVLKPDTNAKDLQITLELMNAF